MLKFLIETEERLEIERSELEFKQQVRISPINIFIPDFYDRMFTPGYIPADEAEEIVNDTFFPTSEEEFEEMIVAFEEEEAAREIRGTFTQS